MQFLLLNFQQRDRDVTSMLYIDTNLSSHLHDDAAGAGGNAAGEGGNGSECDPTNVVSTILVGLNQLWGSQLRFFSLNRFFDPLKK